MIGFVILLVVVIATVSVLCYLGIEKEEIQYSTVIGSQYNAVIKYNPTDDSHEIEYADETGNHSAEFFVNDSMDCLNWIKNNTPSGAIFLCWFDYGHSIKGYSERNVVIRNPSQESLTIMPYLQPNEFDSNEKLLDVSTALLAINASETIDIMHKYNATYIFVHNDDPAKMLWPAEILGLNYTGYTICQELDGTLTPTEKLSQTVLYQLSQNGITGFNLVYQDETAKVYKTSKP